MIERMHISIRVFVGGGTIDSWKGAENTIKASILFVHDDDMLNRCAGMRVKDRA